MRFPVFFAALCFTLNANAQTPAAKLWNDLKAKREAFPGLHQEFEVVQTYTTPTNTQQQSIYEIVLDISRDEWRELTVSGSGNRIRVFDGHEVSSLEEGGDEYVREKRKKEDSEPAPVPYGPANLDWSKASEKDRRPCGVTDGDQTCVVISVPIKHWARTESNGLTSEPINMSEGIAIFEIGSETGILLQCETQEALEDSRGGAQKGATYTTKRTGLFSEMDSNIFKLPAGMRQVKSLSTWDAPRINKQLAGKTAPSLELTDIQGKHISLAGLKGKTVLLDFWTSWCPPCRADAPALEKLYQKFGARGLIIVAISVDEERNTVQRYLKENGLSYPVGLSTENEMPRAYQVGLFPTYIVISPDGTVASAMDGNRGFGELRKNLKKAGMDTD